MNLISISSLREVSNTLRRFVGSSVFAIALAVTMLYLIHVDNPSNEDTYLLRVIMFYCGLAFLLETLLTLWREAYPRRRSGVVEAGAHTLLLLNASWLVYIGPDAVNFPLILAQGSVLLSIFLALCFLPFWQEQDDCASWLFVLTCLRNVSISLGIGLVMMLGVFLLLFAVSNLFDIDIEEKSYLTSATVFGLLLPLLMWLGRMPRIQDMLSWEVVVEAFLHKVVRYLFFPLLGLYALVLYIYGVRILLTWTLPDGNVGLLVSALTIGTIALAFLLYPSLHRGERTFETRLICRWPLVVLPLLILMSVGIGRRLMDYGVTTMRLYAALLNLWFYVVCLGFYFTRIRRIHWVSLSFGGLFLFASILPINFSSIAKSCLVEKLEQLWATNPPPTAPMNEQELKRWLHGFDHELQREIESRLRHLEGEYGQDAISQWVKPDIVHSYSEIIPDQERATPALLSLDFDYSEQPLVFPNGYRFVRQYNFSSTIRTTSSTTIKIGDTNFLLDFATLDEWQKKGSVPNAIILDGGHAAFLPTEVSAELSLDKRKFTIYTLRGYLFTK